MLCYNKTILYYRQCFVMVSVVLYLFSFNNAINLFVCISERWLVAEVMSEQIESGHPLWIHRPQETVGKRAQGQIQTEMLMQQWMMLWKSIINWLNSHVHDIYDIKCGSNMKSAFITSQHTLLIGESFIICICHSSKPYGQWLTIKVLPSWNWCKEIFITLFKIFTLLFPLIIG